jgi:hypothetical protein
VSCPRRGARVVYKEADRSNDEEFDSEEAFVYAAAGEMYQSVLPPPLIPLQLELR